MLRQYDAVSTTLLLFYKPKMNQMNPRQPIYKASYLCVFEDHEVRIVVSY